MSKIKIFASLIVAFLSTLNLFAQSNSTNEENISGVELHGIVYTKQFQGGISFNTNGYSLNFRRMWMPTAFFERGFEADLALIRHPKQIFTTSNLGRPYAYGKLNTLYALRLGFGDNKEIASKIDIGSIEINYFYYAGLTIGGLKPEYIEVLAQGIDYYEIIIEKYDPRKHDPVNIYGRASFTNGFSEMKIYPGIYAKFGLNFDYKISTNKIGTIETGIIADYFFKELPMMYDTTNYSYFVSLYLSINFGRKWN